VHRQVDLRLVQNAPHAWRGRPERIGSGSHADEMGGSRDVWWWGTDGTMEVGGREGGGEVACELWVS
jgi:hypothetical protein